MTLQLYDQHSKAVTNFNELYSEEAEIAQGKLCAYLPCTFYALAVPPSPEYNSVICSD